MIEISAKEVFTYNEYGSVQYETIVNKHFRVCVASWFIHDDTRRTLENVKNCATVSSLYLVR